MFNDLGIPRLSQVFGSTDLETPSHPCALGDVLTSIVKLQQCFEVSLNFSDEPRSFTPLCCQLSSRSLPVALSTNSVRFANFR